MRIVNLNTFLSLPKGTLFQKYSQYNFQDLRVKDDNVGPYTTDFRYDTASEPTLVNADDFDQTVNLLDEMVVDGHSEPLTTSNSRDGLYDPDQLFAIWEKNDIAILREQLDNATLVSTEQD